MTYVPDRDMTVYVDQSDEPPTMYHVNVDTHPERKHFTISPSHYDRQWTASALAHGVTMTLKDFGDGVRFVRTPMNEQQTIIEFTYSEIVELQILLDAYQRSLDYPLQLDRLKPLHDGEDQ